MEAKGVVGASAPHWISVSEQPPKKGVWVLVAYADGFVNISDFIMTHYHASSVTHWMPLPAPPKAGE